MRKSVIPCILLLCFSGVFINGFAANPKSIQNIAGKEFNVKMNQSFADLPLHNNAKESFARHAESFAPSLITAHFITENILYLSFPGLHTGRIISNPVTKHNQKNHLLHLFPSHYFW